MHEDIRIALAVRDETARRELEKAVRAARGVRPQDRGEPCDILIYEVRPDEERDFPRLGKALAAQTRGEVFLTCADPSPDFLIQAMRAGIHEFLPLPVTAAELGRSLARFAARRGGAAESGPGAGGKVTLVAGAKPGTGATTLAVNLACALQARGERTVLLDLRRPLGETTLFLDLEYAYTWGEAAQNLERLDATYLESLLAHHESGLAVLASPGDSLPTGAHGETVRRIISELRRGYDQIVIDGEPGLEGYEHKEADAADHIWLVLNPSLPCLAHARRVLDGLRRGGGLDAKVRIVSARQVKDGDIGPHDMEEVLQKRVAAFLPEDHRAALAAMNQGRPLAGAAPKSPLTRAVDRLARTLSTRETRTGSGPVRSLFGMLRRGDARERTAPAGLEAS